MTVVVVVVVKRYPVVARSPADREVRGSNPTLAKREFLWPQEMILRGSTRPRCELAVSVQVRYSCAPYVGCTQNRE